MLPFNLKKGLWLLSPAFYSLLSIRAEPAEGLPPAASFYVTNLPELHQDEIHPLHLFSGHISSDPSGDVSSDAIAHLFFVMVKNRRVADKERIMFWFNGGPGCSSFDGLMMENGPWRVDGRTGLQTVEGGWEEYTTMVYVDQPAGTGFSYAQPEHFIHSLEEASEHVVQFIRNFYTIFPEYQRMDTYIGGESYAGQYIPYIANAILSSDLPTPLRGLAIGNGWMDAWKQYPSYLDYAVKHGLLEENSEGWKVAKKDTDQCLHDLKKSGYPNPIKNHVCEGLLMKVVKSKERTVHGRRMCVNVYDIRYEDTLPACGLNWPPDIHNITVYLDRPDVVQALHAEGRTDAWVECRHVVHRTFDETKSNSSVTLLPELLEKIPILLFAGDQDLICNYVGIEAMIQSLTWNGVTGFGTVETQSWSVNGTAAGTWVSNRNLTYVKLFNASHMAPFDVPHATHDMILRFMGVNFSAITDGSARIPSSVGTEVKPLFLPENKPKATFTPVPGKTPQQDKAMWEAYYNAGSAALVLLLILLAIGIFLWCRVRRRRTNRPLVQNEEESIPLTRSMGINDEHPPEEDDEVFVKRKGKERAPESAKPPIFDVGDDDDDEGYKSPHA